MLLTGNAVQACEAFGPLFVRKRYAGLQILVDILYMVYI